MSAPFRNVVLITTDQQRFDSLGCNGGLPACTPNLDALAGTGLNFQNHIVSNPVCSPSRASIMTGRHITEHGLWANGCDLPRDIPTLPQIMREHGFQTAHFGKLHLEAIIRRGLAAHAYGFQTCAIAEGDQQLTHDAYYLWLRDRDPNLFLKLMEEAYGKGQASAYTTCVPEELHLTTWVTQQALDWLRYRRVTGQPFLLSVGYFDPHHPFNPCEPYASRFAQADVPEPRFDEAALATKPPHYQAFFRGMRGVTRDLDAMRAIRRAYSAMVAHVDHNVGQLVAALHELGLARDTAVIFTSDHGEFLGEHGLLWKGPYLLDDLMKVPMLINIPGQPIRPAGGERITALTSAVDLVGTVQALAGVRTPFCASGRRWCDADLNLFPDGENPYVRAQWEHPQPGPTSSLRMVRTQTWKLITYADPNMGELYDLEHDPHEQINRYHDPAAAAARRELTAILERHPSVRPNVPARGAW